ncbi:MAG: hypothetical protein KF706_11415 [Chitinophagales bacterium]|nr:hypothetical protein [Chitinophagales bacterium]
MKIRQHKKAIATFFLVLMVQEMLFTTASFALTGGPSQPEVQSFEPANVTQMVDKFSGDFTYNLNLMDVGGYPLNISYHSGITMDQEASVVGLGWNFNPGVINRSLRSLPDDFKDEDILKEFNMRKNWTAGANLGMNLEPVTVPIGIAPSFGVFYNNYKGIGFETGFSFSYSFKFAGGKGKNTASMGLGISLMLNSQEGTSIQPNISISVTHEENSDSKMGIGGSIGIAYNSRVGLSQLSYGISASSSVEKKGSKNKRAEQAAAKREVQKAAYSSKSANGGSSISFLSHEISPTITLPIKSFSFSGKLMIGGLIPAAELNISGTITGHYSEQKLKYKRETLKGFGYLYLQDARMNPRALLDFTREKDIPFRKPSKKSGDEGTPIAPIPSFDYDLMSVNGHGISGQYRPRRGDLASVYDHQAVNESNSGSFLLDIGLGSIVDVGGDINVLLSKTVTSQWKDGNDLFNQLSFKDYDNSLFEPAYYVNNGEKTIVDESFLNSIGGDDPLRVKLEKSPVLSVKARNSMERFRHKNFVNSFPLSKFKKEKRDKRNQVITYLTAEEASVSGVSKKIQIYPLNKTIIDKCGVNDSLRPKEIDRVLHSGGRGHHLSEITVLSDDGRRYVYGIPAYNRVQKDLTFNTDRKKGAGGASLSEAQAFTRNQTDIVTGYTTYQPSECTIGNEAGKDWMFSSQKMPGYAHSFLVSAVLSPDYVDIDNNGLSDNDLGDGVKFNYSRIAGNSPTGSDLYKWRVPYKHGNYQEGFKSKLDDDKANYTYGEKEIWHVHSIESKTMIAVFKYSPREDAMGANNEETGDKGPGSVKLVKLDSIMLYAKSDLMKDTLSAIPIKTVHFSYSYELCKKIPNNSGSQASGVNEGGKLTLKKVWFTYQKNTKGKLNPYLFNYDLSNNPDYNFKKYDRWGNYKNNYDPAGSALPGYQIPEAEFPYTPQSKSLADKYAKAWSLKSIDLPSGGKIEVEYEADDYAYVGDKIAGQMFSIVGFDTSADYKNKNTLYELKTDPLNPGYVFKRFIYVKVSDPITSGSKAEVMEKYLKGIDYIYYKCAIKMKQDDADEKAEYIPGYFKIEDYGVCAGHPDIIWLKTEEAKLDAFGTTVNPILKDALQFIRMNLPGTAYPGSEPGDASPLSAMKAIAGMIMDIPNAIRGFSRTAVELRRFCKVVVLNRSFIRLNNPYKVKYGGGSRVKTIKINDNWSQMSSSSGVQSGEYGQNFDYTMLEGNKIISSGAASYEPLMGGDENSYRQPLKYKQTTRLAPANNFFVEFPLGESFYPSAEVGYRQVKASSIQNPNVPAHKGTGYTIDKYYTAYDFPIFSDYTPLPNPAINPKTPSFVKVFQLPYIESIGISQGFQVELNDMHGKERSSEVFDNNGSLISGTYTYYKVENSSNLQMKLDNRVSVMMPDGTIPVDKKEVGKDVELIFDSRKQKTTSQNIGAAINVDLNYLPPIIFWPLVTVIPAFGREQVTYNSFSTMKVVRRYGIIDKIVTKQEGSSVESQNLVFDSETGSVLLTRTQNEFDDPVFNFTYPAHLVYDGMGGAYKNSGAVFRNVSLSNGNLTSPGGITQHFVAGDEVYAKEDNGFAKKLWVINPQSLNPSASSQIIFIDVNGKPASGNYATVKITRSGRRNMPSTPIGSLVTLNNPFTTPGVSVLPDTSNKIINVSFTEFSEFWQTNCQKLPFEQCDSCGVPDCCCVEGLLKQIINEGNLMARPEDSVFVNSCCLPACTLDTCSCKPADDCTRRHYYALTTDSFTNNFMAVFGTCTLKIQKGNGWKYWLRDNANLKKLKVAASTTPYVDTPYCRTVCDLYLVKGQYYLTALNSQNLLVPYFASLECGNVCKASCKNLTVSDTINPYRYGLLGNWRPEKQWVYKGLRRPVDFLTDGQTNIRKDGTFETFEPFWIYDATSQRFKKDNLGGAYINATTITKYNTKGAEIENRDAAGIYSSALFGYLHSMPVGVAKNAKYKQIACDNFEDYQYVSDCKEPCRTEHFNFRDCIEHNRDKCKIDSTVAHSGNHSIQLWGSVEAVSRDIEYEEALPGIEFDENIYRLKKSGCLPQFSPDSGKYVISAWIRESGTCTNLQDTVGKLFICFNGSMDTFEFKASGNKIEGWQRIYGVFKVPSGATKIKIQLLPAQGKTTWFDDFRVHPFNGSMQTFVFDHINLRNLALLDDNNYATFYEYDDEGTLIRVKKETERGIMTIKETRSTLKKQ